MIVEFQRWLKEYQRTSGFTASFHQGFGGWHTVKTTGHGSFRTTRKQLLAKAKVLKGRPAK